ncbi:hypothetical protein C3369_17470 [Escherichia sp. ESNIH1]|uniref:cell envelope integrity TolA C-terminal domain-containing protein n=1 Tax=Escherichia sp. ESNIH1 TaxID=1985876 RepID=UPI000CDD8458|nr:cell envelope integrity TolA C-terminal domain-containing protein [Escherichia sp. ESNIH1]POT98920.1 hypothetical protein C3369_17470 [Escherichia sp. ESNIH1]
MKRLITLLVVALLATGCIRNPVTSEGLKADINTNHREPRPTISSWVQSVKSELMSHMDNGQWHEGKMCTIRLFLQPDGLVLGVKSEDGDPALCETAIAAVKQSTFQPVPKELQRQNGILLDFKP